MVARLLVSLEDAALNLGGKPLFENLTLHIAEGEKICLIGRNGAGKTTLMRLLTGDMEIDAGKRFILPGLTVGYLAQQVPVDETMCVREFVLTGLTKEQQTEDKHYLADMMMSPLELEPGWPMGNLSGGQLRRAALARGLLCDPDILLLDEPTNHLDLQAIEWLEGYLAGFRGAVLCVSHDRAFLKAISQKVFWLDRGIVRVCPKSYAGFEEWADGIIEQEARELHNMQKKLNAEVDWTQGGVTARRKRNQRRLRELHRLRDKLRTDKAAHLQNKRTLDLEPLAPSQASKLVAEFKDVSKSFVRDGKTVPIVQHFTGRIMRGDRVGILGRNGSGKSTFLKMLVGDMPQDSGHIRRGKSLEVSYFDQSRSVLNPKKSLWDTLCPDGGDYVYLGNAENQRARHVCGYLKDFLFDPKIARDLVNTLSGGQQNRLLLAKVLAQPGSLLILDEPTNDLDMDTLDMLQEALSDYDGTLIIVSHDRDFLDRTVTRILAFEGDGLVESHVGGYSDYIAAKTIGTKPSASTAKNPATSNPAPVAVSASRMTFKLRHELENLPARIEKLAADIAALQALLNDPTLYARDAEAFDAAARKLQVAQDALAKAEERWLELEEMRIAMAAC